LEASDLNLTTTKDKPEPHILVVDDHGFSRTLMSALLQTLSLNIKMVTNGFEAVDICREKRFDLILMDVNMPVMDGPKAAALIRATCAYNAKTPIIALTASGQEVITKCLNAGMDDYLIKPVTPHALLGKLNLWLKA
jgi:CheY-like chemotaxis protein